LGLIVATLRASSEEKRSLLDIEECNSGNTSARIGREELLRRYLPEPGTD